MSIDLDAIRQREQAATPGPWIAGDPWRVAGVGFRNRGPDVCAYCHLGPPVWTGRCDINGEMMQAHRHRSPDAYAPGHVITSADGYTVAGEPGGINPADAEFIRHAREDIPALLDQVDQLADGNTAWKQWSELWRSAATPAALAEARQELAHRGTGYVPAWDDLNDHDRQMATLEAANWLEALRSVRVAPPVPEAGAR